MAREVNNGAMRIVNRDFLGLEVPDLSVWMPKRRIELFVIQLVLLGLCLVQATIIILHRGHIVKRRSYNRIESFLSEITMMTSLIVNNTL